MKVGLLNSAPIGPNLTKWGDYQFGRSLAAALNRLGVEVEQRFWPEWEQLGPVDLCVTLRGKRGYPPRPAGAVNAVWVISHPAALSLNELERYDLVFTASETHRALLAGKLDRPIEVLRQCTDPALFHTARSIEDEAMQRRGALFVANSRGIGRPVLAAMLAKSFPVSIIGRHWRSLGLSDLVRTDFVENDRLPDVYRGCRLALNDHWCDMKYFGVINNRIFDCLASGTPVITDRFPELESVCGDGVLYAEDDAALEAAILSYHFDYEGLLERTRALWSAIGADYTFDRRAQQIVDVAAGANPQLGAPGEHSNPPDVEQLHAALEGVKAALKRDLIQVLHVSPQPHLQQALAARGDIEYVTAGRGVGPWLVDLSDGPGILPRGRFHYAILENGHGLDLNQIWPLMSESGRLVVLDAAFDGKAGETSVVIRELPAPERFAR